MNTYFTMAMLCLMASPAFSQILFEEGYFIENSGNRVDCLIRNVDWKNNPDKFRYKMGENGEGQTADIADVKEFGILGTVLYKRYTLDIDRRSYLTRDLGFDRNPDFNEERLFLKVLVSGKASLFVYEDGNLIRYFYSIENQKPQQLVYTRYKTQGQKTLQNFNHYRTEGQKILENFYYKSQLAQDLKCEGITSTDIDGTEYKEDHLVAYFSRYNNCFGQDYSVLGQDGDNGLFHIRIRPGIDLNSFKVRYFQSNVPETDLGQHLGLRIGAELEMVMSFNKNKWAITFEPFYRSYKTEKDNDTHAEYSSLVTALGLRHYFFLGEESKIFINGNFGLDFPFNSDFRVATSVTRRDLEVPNKLLDNYLAVGTGFNWNDKLSVELRYMFNQDLLKQYEFWTADYSSFSIILGYNIL